MHLIWGYGKTRVDATVRFDLGDTAMQPKRASSRESGPSSSMHTLEDAAWKVKSID
jgi:hypothetical protein